MELLLAAILLLQDPPKEEPPDWGDDGKKSYVIPALEIIGFNYLLNLYDRNFQKEDVYRTHWDTIRSNLRHGWIIDDDPFAMNQLLHPYQGAMSHGFARSAGLNYWEALPYDLGGSLLWEVAGETGPPSANDIITTTFGGSFLGESLFRMASLILEHGERHPGTVREIGAALASPATGFNRLAFNRFDGVYSSREAPNLFRAGVGGRRNAHLKDVGAVTEIDRDEFMAVVSMSYGHPGRSGFEYSRPFDYFDFEAVASANSGSLPECVMVRGILAGRAYGSDDVHGLWGLYGVYDYMSPDVFSVSSTALAFGTTLQWRMSEKFTGQSTVLAGMGWTAVGTISDADEDRDFHYGYSPQALMALRFIYGDLLMLDFSGREYYIGSLGSHDDRERENVLRGQVELTVRVYQHHAVGIRFVSTTRNSSALDFEGSVESVGALSLFYTYLSDPEFGVVK
jgi:hypothetical protein